MASSEHFVWAVDGKPVSVHLSADVVKALEVHLSGGSYERGTELGGFLLGRVRQVNDSWMVAVDAMEIAACEHTRGPSFTLSRTDREAFDRQMARLSKRGVVGWFRTHTRPGLYLDQHDFALFRELFAHPASVALAVRPDGQAGFFFWEDGDIERSRPYQTFICRSDALNFTAQPAAGDFVRPGPVKRKGGLRKELLWIPVAAGIAVAAFWSPSLPFDQGRERAASHPGRPVFAPPPEPSAQTKPLQTTAAVAIPRETPPAQVSPDPVPPPTPTRQPAAAPVPPPAVASARVPPAPAVPERKAAAPVQKTESVQMTAEAPKPNIIKRTVGSIPGLGFLKKTKSDDLDAPPTIARQVRPTRFDESYPVRVKVKIGADGYVKSAHLLTTSASAATASSVMRAVRGWRFKPARQANRSVESEMVVTFRPEDGTGNSL